VRETDRRRAALEDRVRHAERDLEELARQVEDGEIDEETAARLEDRYRADLDAAEASLGELPAERKHRPGREEADEERGPAARALSGRGLLALAGVMVVLTIGIVVLATRGGDEGAGTATTAPAAADLPSTGDPVADMEAAVAAHPDSNEMRLALGGLLFDRGEYLTAMEHYIFVLENEPTTAEESVALTRVGWMAYVTGQNEAAEDYLRSAIEVDPAYGEAKLFLGVVLLYGNEDPDGAIPLLEEVLTYPDLPEGLRPDVEGMLADARATAGGEG
jgi:tetratricopeptide (TPR) repeat protein